MVLVIKGDAGSGKTKTACKYASQRGKFLIVDFNRGFYPEFHAPNMKYEVLNAQTLESTNNVISQLLADMPTVNTLILDDGWQICNDRVLHTEKVRQLIDLCNLQGIDLIICHGTYHVDLPSCTPIEIPEEEQKKYISYDLANYYPIITLPNYKA